MMPPGKPGQFCIRYFSKTKTNPAKKPSEQCFSGKTKPTCQNSAIFEHFENDQKILGTFLPAALPLFSENEVPYVTSHAKTSLTDVRLTSKMNGWQTDNERMRNRCLSRSKRFQILFEQPRKIFKRML